MNIGSFHIAAPVALAPMAGITDKPFRMLCRRFGAGYAVSEMLTGDPSLRHTAKTLRRSDFDGETGIRAVQIVGSDPQVLAEAARYNVGLGAQIIDINMGCPVKKVSNVLAGSALLKDEALVGRILDAVAAAAGVPVTLKTRLGWSGECKNLPSVARMAENAGIAAIAVHGRTREQMYGGAAEYDLIAEVKSRIRIPLWVNGDIDSPQKAAEVMRRTGADGVMIGRAAQGQPWLLGDTAHYLQHGTLPPPPSFQTASAALLQHLEAMYAFYGATAGVRIARKHIGWYLKHLPGGEAAKRAVNQIQDADGQYRAVAVFLERLPQQETWPCAYRRGS